MNSILQPGEPLSQVVFIHDYIQLVFQDERFSLYNRILLRQERRSLHQGQAGFADALTSLIGQRVSVVGKSEESVLTLTFESGVVVHVPRSGTAAKCVEAFQFHGREHRLHVEHNA